MAQKKSQSSKVRKKQKQYRAKFPIFPLLKASSSEKIYINGEIIHLDQELEDLERCEACGFDLPPNWREEIVAKIEKEREKMKRECDRKKTVARRSTATN